MQLGLFTMPIHPLEKDWRQSLREDQEAFVLADELGFDEAWIGEHFTSPWEPIPSPDLMIAQALMRTKRIKLAPGAHLLPFHHPAELAHRVAYMDHLSQGRLMFGVGAGNLGWMLVLGSAMAIEKNMPWGWKLSAPLGLVLIGSGLLTVTLQPN